MQHKLVTKGSNEEGIKVRIWISFYEGKELKALDMLSVASEDTQRQIVKSYWNNKETK